MSDIEESIIEELHSTEEQVRYLLGKYPEARDSDTYLEWLWMRYFKGINLPWLEYQKLAEFSLETVRRTRQKIQSSGELIPLKSETLSKRRIKRTIYTKELVTQKETWEYGESI